MKRQAVLPLIRQALREDAAERDVTARSALPASARVRAQLLANASGILAGGAVAVWTFRMVGPSLRCVLRRRDGARFRPGQTLLTVEGSARSILAAERTALNVLSHLCGVATLTQAFVQRVRPFRAKIFDTRKTLPGLRILEKYAVKVGGGWSHRTDLAETVLIKTNHLRALRLAHRRQHTAHRGVIIQRVIAKAKRIRPRRFVEIEVTNLSEFRAALDARPDAILLDNWRIEDIRKVVQFLNAERSTLSARPLLEVSGGVTLRNVRAIAATGVDRISIGRLTHSAPSLDLSLNVR